MKKDVLFILVVVVAGMIAISIPHGTDEDQLIELFYETHDAPQFKVQGFKKAQRPTSGITTDSVSTVDFMSSPASTSGYEPSRFDTGLAGEETEFEKLLRQEKAQEAINAALSKENWVELFAEWEAALHHAAISDKSIQNVESASCEFKLVIENKTLMVKSVSDLSMNVEGSRIIFSYDKVSLTLFSGAGTKNLVKKTEQLITFCRDKNELSEDAS